jgi:hypothetical protein
MRSEGVAAQGGFLGHARPDVLDRVQSGADVQATMDSSDRWITLAFTWNGLRMLGVPGGFADDFCRHEFCEGMAAWASILGDTGDCAPEHWIGGLAGDDLYAIAIVFSRTEEQRHARSRGPAITGAEPGVLILVASADSPLRRICLPAILVCP